MNLGTINSTTEGVIDHSLYECRESLKMAFEVSLGTTSKSKGGPGHLNFVSSQGFRNKVWSELEKVFSEDIYQLCKQVCNLNVIFDFCLKFVIF